MADKKNRTCIVCSEKYRYCPSCAEFAHLEPWHSIFHDDNCREIFNAVSAYLGKEKTKEETKIRLDKCNLSNKASFKKSILDAIEEVYTSEAIDSNVANTVNIEFIKTNNVVEEIDTNFDDVKTEEVNKPSKMTSKGRRKKNYEVIE